MSGTAPQVTSLARRAKDGDRGAFDQLVELFQEPIFRMVYYRTGSNMDAEDLTQDIFMKAFRSLHTLKDKTRFRSWLFTIAVNRVRDFHKKKRFLVFFDREGEMKDPDASHMEINDDSKEVTHMMRREFWDHVRNFADKLSRWEREVFLLRFLDDLTIREIAQALSKSESAVKTHLYRAIKKFKANNELTRLLIGEIQ